MTPFNAQQVQKKKFNYRVSRPTQTGFSSPATHYHEPRIDLNNVLVSNSEATFYIRAADEQFAGFGIEKNDVLIVDKSLTPKLNQLTVATVDGNFEIIRINEENREELNIWGVITYIMKSVL